MRFLIQSWFKALHSTDAALLNVKNDLLLSGDSWENAILVLLDFSVVFNTVARDFLLAHL